MPMGMLYISIVCFNVVEAYVVGIHIGMGFCVARSNGNGQCEGLYARNGQQVQTPALFLYVTIPLFLTPPAPGARRQKQKKR